MGVAAPDRTRELSGTRAGRRGLIASARHAIAVQLTTGAQKTKLYTADTQVLKIPNAKREKVDCDALHRT
jgi:hypothetical protein